MSEIDSVNTEEGQVPGAFRLWNSCQCWDHFSQLHRNNHHGTFILWLELQMTSVKPPQFVLLTDQLKKDQLFNKDMEPTEDIVYPCTEIMGLIGEAFKRLFTFNVS